MASNHETPQHSGDGPPLPETISPAELWQALVESAFDPFAYSHGRAAGLWQFIPGTGKRFGLKQNWWYDGRRDIWSSTHAALDYLDHLSNKFDGDWLLALAGYNAGEGAVREACEFILASQGHLEQLEGDYR